MKMSEYEEKGIPSPEEYERKVTHLLRLTTD